MNRALAVLKLSSTPLPVTAAEDALVGEAPYQDAFAAAVERMAQAIPNATYTHRASIGFTSYPPQALDRHY